MDKKINYTIGWYLYWRTQMQWDSSRRLSSVGSRAHPCIKCVVPDYERKARGFDVPVMVISWGEPLTQTRLESKCWVVVLSCQRASELEPDGELTLKRQVPGPHPRNSNSVGLWWGLKICIVRSIWGSLWCRWCVNQALKKAVFTVPDDSYVLKFPQCRSLTLSKQMSLDWAFSPKIQDSILWD